MPCPAAKTTDCPIPAGNFSNLAVQLWSNCVHLQQAPAKRCTAAANRRKARQLGASRLPGHPGCHGTALANRILPGADSGNGRWPPGRSVPCALTGRHAGPGLGTNAYTRRQSMHRNTPPQRRALGLALLVAAAFAGSPALAKDVTDADILNDAKTTGDVVSF